MPFRAAVSSGAPSLRVGIVLDREQRAPWVEALLAFLRQIPGIDVSLLTIASQVRSESKPTWLMDRLYSASRAKFDPFGNFATNGDAFATAESFEAIRAADCGVLIWLAGCRDPGVELHRLTKYGVFTVRFGNGDRIIPFWKEVATGSSTSATTIFWHDSSFAQGRVVRRAETSTCHGLYFTENAEEPLAATMRMLASLCLDIQHVGSQFGEQARALAPHLLETAVQHNYPSNFEASRFILKKLARSSYRRYTMRGKEGRWFVAIRPNAGESITDPARMNLSGFQDVPLPNGVEAMADPFLYETCGRQFLLFEAVKTGKGFGRLACMEILAGGSFSEMSTFLERPYHLSYPCVVPANDDLFLIPESSEASRVDVYRFSRFPSEVELIASPIEGIALVDTTPIFIDGLWYFFTTTGEPFLETLLFSASRIDGPWSLHPCSPVSTSVKNSRSAGNLFWKNGRLFRPTQDCSVRYGYAMTVNEVTKLTSLEFEEHPVSYLPPLWKTGLLGTHTWNESGKWQVLDGRRLVSLGRKDRDDAR